MLNETVTNQNQLRLCYMLYQIYTENIATHSDLLSSRKTSFQCLQHVVINTCYKKKKKKKSGSCLLVEISIFFLNLQRNAW